MSLKYIALGERDLQWRRQTRRPQVRSKSESLPRVSTFTFVGPSTSCRQQVAVDKLPKTSVLHSSRNAERSRRQSKCSRGSGNFKISNRSERKSLLQNSWIVFCCLLIIVTISIISSIHSSGSAHNGNPIATCQSVPPSAWRALA